MLVFASSNPFTFSAGADIKEFTKMDEASGKELIDSAHGFLRSMEESSTVTIASVNSIAFGGGNELAMACDFRIAAESATFAQPEINLGIIPGFGGTQRLPRLVGEGKALELNLVGNPIGSYEALRLGLVNQVVPDHELFDTVARVGAEAVEAGAGRDRADQARCRPTVRSTDGIEAEKHGVRHRVPVRGREGGNRRVPRQALARFQGQVAWRLGSRHPPPRGSRS